MATFDEYDDEHYHNYEETQNEIDKLTNLQAFDPSERHHIANLIVKRNRLKKGNENRKRLGINEWNELQALNWVLSLLEEISKDDEESA